MTILSPFKACQWCGAGIYLLASQAVDKCQTQEGAETALCDIERFLETAKEHQLLNGKEFYNQFDMILTPEIKVGIERGALLAQNKNPV